MSYRRDLFLRVILLLPAEIRAGFPGFELGLQLAHFLRHLCGQGSPFAATSFQSPTRIALPLL